VTLPHRVWCKSCIPASKDQTLRGMAGRLLDRNVVAVEQAMQLGTWQPHVGGRWCSHFTNEPMKIEKSTW